MTRSRPVAALALLLALVTTVAPAGPAAAQTRPEGEMRFAFYVTSSPAYSIPARSPASSRPPGPGGRCTTRS